MPPNNPVVRIDLPTILECLVMIRTFFVFFILSVLPMASLAEEICPCFTAEQVVEACQDRGGYDVYNIPDEYGVYMKCSHAQGESVEYLAVDATVYAYYTTEADGHPLYCESRHSSSQPPRGSTHKRNESASQLLSTGFDRNEAETDPCYQELVIAHGILVD